MKPYHLCNQFTGSPSLAGRTWPPHESLRCYRPSNELVRARADCTVPKRGLPQPEDRIVLCARAVSTRGAGPLPVRPRTDGKRNPVEQHPLCVTSSEIRDFTFTSPAHAYHRRAPRVGARGRPWTDLHAKLQQSLSSNKLLDTDSVLVAVSGGQDSVCLLQALVDLQPLWRWRLGVVHCDHGWRADSAANAEFVRELVEERLGLPCHVRTAPPGAVPSERAAREWRYRMFAEVATAHGYAVVVTGHTATDRAETMLLNLLRGSGPDGLVALAQTRPLAATARSSAPATAVAAAAAAQADGNEPSDQGLDAPTAAGGGDCDRPSPRAVLLTRPLLVFSRGDTLKFVQTLGLPYYHDTTNDSNDLRRNRLRNEVLPALREGFNPRLDQALFRFVEVLSAEMEYLAQVTEQLYDNVVSYSHDASGRGDSANIVNGSSALHRQEFSPEAKLLQSRSSNSGCSGDHRSRSGALKLEELRKLPLAMQRRVVRRWLEEALDQMRSAPLRLGHGDDDGVNGNPGQSRGGGGEAPGRVRFEDVARCLALLHAPNRANSDSLCGGLVASVRTGQLVLLRPGAGAAEPADGPGQQQHERVDRRTTARKGVMRDGRERQASGAGGPCGHVGGGCQDALGARRDCAGGSLSCEDASTRGLGLPPLVVPTGHAGEQRGSDDLLITSAKASKVVLQAAELAFGEWEKVFTA